MSNTPTDIKVNVKYQDIKKCCWTNFFTVFLFSLFINSLFTKRDALHNSSAGAVNRIYEIKGRIQTRPLAICVADILDISRFALVDHLPHGLLDSLLPGPVTVVLKRGADTTPF